MESYLKAYLAIGFVGVLLIICETILFLRERPALIDPLEIFAFGIMIWIPMFLIVFGFEHYWLLRKG